MKAQVLNLPSALYSENRIRVVQLKIKTTVKTERQNIHKNVLNTLQNYLNESQKFCLNFIYLEKGVSSWLTSYPINYQRFNPIKQQLWNSLGLAYGWVLPNMLSTCCCSGKMHVQHAVSYRRGGFATV